MNWLASISVLIAHRRADPRTPGARTCKASSGRSAELFGEPDQKSFRPPDVAEPIRVFVLDHFADELCAALAEPGERIVDVLHGEHDAQVAEGVHRGVP